MRSTTGGTVRKRKPRKPYRPPGNLGRPSAATVTKSQAKVYRRRNLTPAGAKQLGLELGVQRSGILPLAAQGAASKYLTKFGKGVGRVSRGPAGFTYKVGRDLGDVALHAPGGIYTLGKAAYQVPRHGNVHPLADLFKSMGVATYEDLRHPLRRPGYTLLDALALATGGSSTAARASGALSRASRPIRYARAANKGGKFDMLSAAASRHGTPHALDPKLLETMGLTEKEVAEHAKTYGRTLREREAGKGLVFRRGPGQAKMNKRFVAGQAVKAALKKAPEDFERPRTRILTTKSRSAKEEENLTRLQGLPGKGQVGRTHKVPVPLARPLPTALAQRATDALRRRSKGMQARKVTREMRRQKDILDRLHEFGEPGVIGAIKQVRKGGATSGLKTPIREANAAIRAARLYKPGYIPPNVAGSAIANLMQGSLRPSIYRQQKRLRKVPRFRKHAGSVHTQMGGGISQAAVEAGVKKGGKVGPIETVTRGMGESFGKITDRPARERAWIHETHKQGYKTDEQILDLLRDAKRGVPKAKRDIIQIVRRAEPEAIKFSKTPGGKLSHIDAALARNIFLYRWLQASSVYAGRTIAHHPVKSAFGAQLSRQSPRIEDVFAAIKAEVPGFMKGYVPTGGSRGKNPMVMPAQSFSLWQSPVDLYQAITHPTREGLSQLAPVQSGALIALTGKDPFTGKELKNPSDRERLYFALNRVLGSSPYMRFNPVNVGRFAKGGKGKHDYALPKGSFYDTKEEREARLFPRTREDILAQFLLGGWFPEPVNPEVATSMARSRDQSKRKHRKRKKKGSSWGSSSGW